MKKIELHQTVQILANVGVIAGIIFLGVELSQNNQLLRIQARSNYESGLSNIKEALYENRGGLSSIIVAAGRGDELTGEQWFQLSQYNDMNLMVWESMYIAHLEGVVDESDLDTVAWSGVLDSLPRLIDRYEFTRPFRDPRFVEWMDENVLRAPEEEP